MIINGIEVGGGGTASGSSGTSGTSGTSGVDGSSGTSGVNGTSGTSITSNRFITSETTLGAGLEQVLNDMFILSSQTYNISSFNATYLIAGNVIRNNAHLNILNALWIDGILYVEGDLTLGLPQNNSFENLISIT